VNIGGTGIDQHAVIGRTRRHHHVAIDVHVVAERIIGDVAAVAAPAVAPRRFREHMAPPTLSKDPRSRRGAVATMVPLSIATAVPNRLSVVNSDATSLVWNVQTPALRV
jgi:hypothetical protein